ncbi:MAG: LPP20 family lipoprotein [Treponema sp.]|jgi:hypothetical protein|nr:LPP20 family lipoprotein [Treponema sp.]
MFKVGFAAAALMTALVFSGCAGSAGVQKRSSEDEAAAAAAAALGDLDAALGGGKPGTGGAADRGAASSSVSPAASASSAMGTSPVSGQDPVPRQEPLWVSAPDKVYDRAAYVAAVGYGSERSIAEKNAFAALTALFGQTIQGEQIAATKYSEAVLNGAVDSWSENTEITNAIKTSAELESLIGAEIKDYWYDGKTTHYAAAVMERAKTVVLYRDMIRTNEQIITGLVTMPDRIKNSLDGYSRFIFAGTIADANRVFANVLSVVGNADPRVAGLDPGAMQKGDHYRLEAVEIAKKIPIQVKVSSDSADRIRSAFVSAITQAGFRAGTGNSRYLLDVSVALSPVDLPNQSNKFVRYAVDAKLTDQETASILLPYNISGRSGHLTVTEAENRAYSDAVRSINETYGDRLSAYLAALLPEKK